MKAKKARKLKEKKKAKLRKRKESSEEDSDEDSEVSSSDEEERRRKSKLKKKRRSKRQAEEDDDDGADDDITGRAQAQLKALGLRNRGSRRQNRARDDILKQQLKLASKNAKGKKKKQKRFDPCFLLLSL